MFHAVPLRTRDGLQQRAPPRLLREVLSRPGDPLLPHLSPGRSLLGVARDHLPPLSSFLQWYRSRVDKVGSAKLWIYAAGHPALITEVEDYVRSPARFGGVPLDVVTLAGKGLDWPALLESLRATSLQRQVQLTLIRDAHLVPQEVWLELDRWKPKHDSHFTNLRHVLATSTERWNTRDKDDSRYLTFRKKHSVHVECRIPPEKQVEYVKLKLGAGRPSSQLAATAEEIVMRCGGDLSRLKSECEKLIVYCGDRPVILDDVDTVVTPSPGELFVDALVALRKKEACERAPYVGSLPFVLGSLDRRLGTLHMIHVARKDRSSGRRPSVNKIAERTGVPYFEVMLLERYARNYLLSDVKRRYHLLVQAYLRMASTRDEAHPEWTLLPLVSDW